MLRSTFVETGLGGGSGELLSGPLPGDVWLFKQILGDFGHVSAVSAVSGKRCSGVSSTMAEIRLNRPLAGLRGGGPQAPIPWATTELGSGCYAAPVVASRGWELRVGQSADPTASAEEAVDRVLTSAFVEGIGVSLPLTNVVTLHYGEGLSPPVSEYIVIVSAAQAN